jgi:predicted TIM-barrel fold metal-dependent hydrolase
MPSNQSPDWMISVDDHVIEPAHVWTDRLPKRHLERGPHFVVGTGGPTWVFEDQEVPIGGAVTNGAIPELAKRQVPWRMLDFDRIHPSCYDPVERSKAMDQDHVLASLVFANLPGFCGNLFTRAKDKDLALLCVKAWNDWMLDEWCADAPGRFIPNALVPLWDSHEAAKELERMASRGVRAFSFSQHPHKLGLPSIHDAGRYWDPLFSVANDAEIVICTHLGSSSSLPRTSDDAPNPVSQIMFQLWGQDTLIDWLFSGQFQRFPNLKLALSENGISWIPAVLQVSEWMQGMARTMDTIPGDSENEPTVSYEDGEEDTNEVSGKAFFAVAQRSREQWRVPAVREQFRDHVFGCFIDDPHGIKNLDEIGVDNVMIETDFPHSSTRFPNSAQLAGERLASLSEEDRYKILQGNARRVFRFEPAEVAAAAVPARTS